MKRGTKVIIVSVACVAVVFLLKDRLQKGEVKFGGSSASLEAAQQQPGVQAKNITSIEGGLKATDKTGKGVAVSDSTIAKDVILENSITPK